MQFLSDSVDEFPRMPSRRQSKRLERVRRRVAESSRSHRRTPSMCPPPMNGAGKNAEVSIVIQGEDDKCVRRDLLGTHKRRCHMHTNSRNDDHPVKSSQSRAKIGTRIPELPPPICPTLVAILL